MFSIIEQVDISWLWTFILLPVIYGFSKKFISELISDYSIYKNRKFDDNINPKVGKAAHIQSAATGSWIRVIIDEYKFSILSPSKRIINTIQTISNGKKLVVAYTYKQWKTIIKGKEI